MPIWVVSQTQFLKFSPTLSKEQILSDDNLRFYRLYRGNFQILVQLWWKSEYVNWCQAELFQTDNYQNSRRVKEQMIKLVPIRSVQKTTLNSFHHGGGINCYIKLICGIVEIHVLDLECLQKRQQICRCRRACTKVPFFWKNLCALLIFSPPKLKTHRLPCISN